MSQLVPQLEAVLDQFNARLRADPVFAAMLNGTATREQLTWVYTQVWHCIQETPRALRAAAETIAAYASGDPRYAGEEYQRFKTPFYAGLLAEMREHSSEETGHDDWMKEDLVVLGVPAEEVERSRPAPAMAAYLAVLRHAARSRTPLGVWGQAYVLEGLTHTFWGPAADALVARAAITEIGKAVYCIRGHQKADVGHRAEAQRRLASLEDRRDQEAVLFNARATMETWGGLTHDLLRAANA